MARRIGCADIIQSFLLRQSALNANEAHSSISACSSLVHFFSTTLKSSNSSPVSLSTVFHASHTNPSS